MFTGNEHSLAMKVEIGILGRQAGISHYQYLKNMYHNIPPRYKITI